MAASSSKKKTRRKSGCNCGCAADAGKATRKKRAAKKKAAPKTRTAKKPASRKKAAKKKSTQSKTAKKTSTRKKAAKKVSRKSAAPNKAAKQAANEKSVATPAAPSAPPQDIKLDGKVDISSIATLRERLSAALETGESLSIDASAVDSVDTASLQLLVAFANKASKRAQTLAWVEVSDALRERATLLDLDTALDLDGNALLAGSVELCPVF